jgi:hypothetical protein
MSALLRGRQPGSTVNPREVISFAAGTTDRHRFDAQEPVVSSVLPLLTQTPESMLNPGW